MPLYQHHADEMLQPATPLSSNQLHGYHQTVLTSQKLQSMWVQIRFTYQMSIKPSHSLTNAIRLPTSVLLPGV